MSNKKLYWSGVGYASKKWTPEQLKAVCEKYHAVVVDIRLKPQSQWQPTFNHANLARTLGKSYVWIEALGNTNYQGDGRIILKNQSVGLEKVATIIKAGQSIILLCACSKEHTCHRRIVGQLLERSFELIRLDILPPEIAAKVEMKQLTLF